MSRGWARAGPLAITILTSVCALVLNKILRGRRGKGEKHDNKWVGPFRITKALGKGLNRLESLDKPPEIA